MIQGALSCTTSNPLGHVSYSSYCSDNRFYTDLNQFFVQPDGALPWAQCHAQRVLCSVLLAPIYVQPKIQWNLRPIGLFSESRA